MYCRKCCTEIQVSGGMVGSTWVGPADKDLVCLKPGCGAQGYDNFFSKCVMGLNANPCLELSETCSTCNFPKYQHNFDGSIWFCPIYATFTSKVEHV